VRILAIADIEVAELKSNPPAALFGKIDLILSCGDLAPEYLTLVREQINAPLYYVLGNHDLRYPQSPPVGCTDLSFATTRINGLNLLGLSGSRWYNGGTNQYHETEMRLRLLKLSIGQWLRPADIIFAHSPMRHVHDAEDRCHRGFRCYHTLINRCKPRYFLHGHIHANFRDDTERITQVNTTQIINCCGYYVFEM
jgi:Icc-related predicted phosphoesterase